MDSKNMDDLIGKLESLEKENAEYKSIFENLFLNWNLLFHFR